jgi:dTDP-4-dehydrorhamnose 3,5-epimerase
LTAPFERYRPPAMEARETTLPDALLIVPTVHGDERGFFQETYRRECFESFAVREEFVQHNQSRSSRGVLRGMHLQIGEGISKLVRCARGEIRDVIVDVRRGSPTYGRWEAFTLDDRLHHQLYVPVGFAHGFCVLSEVADVVYQQSGYYDPLLERTLAFDDPDIGIEWPAHAAFTVSERDRTAPRLHELADELPFVYASRR